MRKEKRAGEERAATGHEPVAVEPREAPVPAPVASNEPPFPIAGIAGAEGALAPALELVHVLGASPGLAAVLILDLPDRPDDLEVVVRREAAMPVEVITEGLQPRVDHVYLAPPATKITLADRRFHVQPIDGELAAPIDLFLCSLAEDVGERALAVLLSGAGTDGLRGMRAVKEEGGFTLAQDDGAEYPQLPHAAVLGGVDSVLPPRRIAKELLRMSPHSATMRRLPAREMHVVFSLLQRGHDIDFTHYKPATIERRIRRRMSVHRTSELKDYVAVLRENPAELQHLYNEILIRVTSFFRDPDVFDTLRDEILPRILHGRGNDEPVRIWVPGCATGEEVYSLAILLVEAAADIGYTCPFQIFGTDLSEVALERARQGLYAEGIVEEVSPERLRRFFTRAHGGYRISKSVRDCCIFARQNVTRDPPFSRLDLISCRNVMIYLGATLQRKVMGIFHYGLRADGYLLLGSSETIGNYGELFSTADRRHKIYQKKAGVNRMAVDFSPSTAPHEPAERIRMIEETQPPPVNVFREADRILLSRYSPPGVLINEHMDILQFRGRTSRFLEPPAGVASFNVLKMAREGLLAELRGAIEEARRLELPVRREHVRVHTEGDTTLVNLEIVPFLTPGKERYQLILFDEVVPAAAAGGGKQKKKDVPPEDPGQAARLQRELDGTREYLQSIIEEQEAMNEELCSANEEIQSSNEELQSTNEELETAKEELQSSNEELTTLNEELENRNDELAQANDDLVNLLSAVELPILILDGQLQLRRFNPAAQRALSLVGGDIGRPLREVRSTLRHTSLDELVYAVIEKLEPRELEVQDREGTTYLLRVRPYKTSDNRIDGAVLVLIDIDQFRKLKP